MSDIFDIQTRRDRNNSIQGQDYIYAYDTGHGSSISQTAPPKDFTITVHDTSSWLLPNESTLDLRFRVEYSDDSKATWKKATAGLTNMILGDITQIFEKISLSIGGVTVEELSNHAGIVRHVEHLVDMSKQYRDTIGDMMLMSEDQWYIDNDEVGIGNASKEGSLMHKMDLVQGGDKVVNLSIPLSLLFDTFKYYTKVMTGVPIQVELRVRDDDAFFRRSVNADNYGRIVWKDNGITLKMAKVTPALSIREKLAPLRDSDAKLHLDGYETRVNVIDIDGANQNGVQEIIAKGATTIKHALVFFKNKKRLTGSAIDVSPNVLDHFHLSRLSVSLNGEKWRQRDYVTGFPNNLFDIAPGAGVKERYWNDPYTELMKHAGAMSAPVDDHYQGQCTIDYQQFGSKYPVFVFDLSRSDTTVTPNSNSLTVAFNRSDTDGEQYRMYVVTYSPKTVEVNIKSGNVNVVNGSF